MFEERTFCMSNVSLPLWWIVAGPKTFYKGESDATRYSRKLSQALKDPSIVETCNDVCLLCVWAHHGNVGRETWVAILKILENFSEEGEEFTELCEILKQRVALERVA